MNSFWIETLGCQVKLYDAGGWQTRVIEHGEGDPVIMMHGLSGHAESFIRNVKALGNAGFRAMSMDALGHGYSAKPTDVTYHSPTFVEHLKRLLDTIGCERAHLVGQSLGGWTAFNFAQKYPERVISLTSITGAGFLLSDEGSKKESEEIHNRVRAVTEKAIATPSREGVRERLEWLMHDKSFVTDELVETRYSIFTLPDTRAAVGKVVAEQAGPENRANLLTEDQLAEIKVPTKIIWSEQNPTTPWTVAKRVSELVPGAQFALVGNAGHWPQFEQAEEVNALLIEWLGGNRK